MQNLPPPPVNHDIEQALLGALLVKNKLVEEIGDRLRPEHFGLPVHGRIYRAILDNIDAGKPANPVTLQPVFTHDAELQQCGGGARYLVQLAASYVTLVNTASYADQIVDLWQRRQLIETSLETIERTAHVDLADPVEEIVAGIEHTLTVVTEQRAAANLIDAGASAQAALDLADLAYKNRGRLLGVPTGIADLDRMLGGLRGGQLIILAGRPSMGKTLFADTGAVAAAKFFRDEQPERPKWVAVFSLEMAHHELSSRRLAAIADLSSTKIMRGEISDDDWARLMDAKTKIAALPIVMDDAPGLTVNDIRHRARRIKRQRGLGLIVIDHLGLLRGSQEARRNGDTAVITEITLALKALAKELDVPVLALSQLNRQLENREDKRPTLADLRQSGSIEQDADVVLFVYRESYYLARSKPVQHLGEKPDVFNTRFNDWADKLNACQNRADIIVAKHRNGEIGTVEAFFDGAKGVFANFYPRGFAAMTGDQQCPV